ncbi:MAG: hypothetical protein RL375_3564 [Pseudomonadota bacterium]
MELNLPILDQLQGCKSVLVTGIGGGYDVFCGLPLYFELRKRGFTVHLANYSFSDIREHPDGTRLSPTLVGVRSDHEGAYAYFPEYFLARWLAQTTGEDIPIWSFAKVGAAPLADDYALLARHLQVDGVVLVDGGVDSLMRGDEADSGTLVEDSISMAAIRRLGGLKASILACIGLGAERDITYAQVFENIAALTRDGAFLGSCSLTPQMETCSLYTQAVQFVHGQLFHDPSVINSSIVSAVDGHFGDFHLTSKTRGSRLWISPLMPIYWFFDFPAVARRSLVLTLVERSQTFREAVMAVVHHTSAIPRRPATKVPL